MNIFQVKDTQKILADLHRIYEAGNLRILAGAGVSVPSGFPDWETLNKRLLHDYLSASLSSVGGHQIAPGNSLVESLAKDVYANLGRDAVAEFVLRSAESSADFYLRLSFALYQNRRLENLYVSDLQRQIASLSIDPKQLPGSKERGDGRRVASIFTTNLDPLLEMAILRAYREAQSTPLDSSVSYRDFRLPRGASDSAVSSGFPQVLHLHGWVDPEGEAGGEIVYAESHYVALQRSPVARANVQTEELFGNTGATLILGMSLTDPNLRRLLYSRSGSALPNGGTSIYYFIRQGDRGLTTTYAAKFWELLKVDLIPFSEYSELPDLIRRIQWGIASNNNPPCWFEASAKFSAINLDSSQWFEFASPLLKTLHAQIKRMYLTEAREEVRITFFAPVLPATGLPLEPQICEVGTVDFEGNFEASSAMDLLASSQKRKLDIRSDNVQGLAGLSFTEGAMKEVTGDNSFGLDFNFTEETRLAFDRGTYRDWRSMLCVPIVGGPFSLPLGVLCIHSNFGKPFWKGIEQNPITFSNFTASILKAGTLLLVSPKRA